MNDGLSNAEHAWVHEHIAAFVDGELSTPSAARVRAHLARCVDCRTDARNQHGLKARLRELRPPHCAAQRDRALSELRQTLLERERTGSAARLPRRRVLAYAAWAAGVLALAWSVRELARPHARLPEAGPVLMAQEAIADYRRRVNQGLPHPGLELAAIQRAVELPTQQIRHTGAQLVTAWITEIRGQRAAALAYRFRSRTVIQYIVSEELLYRPSAVRKSVHRHGRYITHDGRHVLLAWPISGAGVLLVGDLPAHELERLHASR